MLKHKLKLYPPKATIVVYASSPVAQEEAFTIKINGTKNNDSEVKIRKVFDTGNLQDLLSIS